MESGSNYTIRLALLNDSDIIRSFIKDYWKKDHIYVLDKNLFDYDFVDGDNINFILAFDEKKTLKGILGFIKYNTRKIEQIFTVMWKVIANISDPMLGIKLVKFLVHTNPKAQFSTIGANHKTLPIYKYLGFKTGKLEHFFIINYTLKNFKVLKILEDIKINNSTNLFVDDSYRLELLSLNEIQNYFVEPKPFDNNIFHASS